MVRYDVKEARKLWDEFGGVFINDDGELLESYTPTGFKTTFYVGTDREEVWHWFEETFDLSVAKDLMFNN